MNMTEFLRKYGALTVPLTLKDLASNLPAKKRDIIFDMAQDLQAALEEAQNAEGVY